MEWKFLSLDCIFRVKEIVRGQSRSGIFEEEERRGTRVGFYQRASMCRYFVWKNFIIGDFNEFNKKTKRTISSRNCIISRFSKKFLRIFAINEFKKEIIGVEVNSFRDIESWRKCVLLVVLGFCSNLPLHHNLII